MSEADARALPTTLGVIESALFGSAPPVTIGRFEVVQQLGRGGMGVVYAARDPALKRDVAIKVHRGDRGEPGNARLRREAESLAQLRHRNVVTVFEVGESDAGEVFVVMELLAGPTLRRWIETEQPSVAQILGVFTRCARGLQAAHDIALVHRDFKPDNVIVDRDAEPRIIDFGLARADTSGNGVTTDEGDDDRITREGTLVGTPRYMAPELRNGDAPTPASDQFAFAVALFESIAGVPPFADGRYERPRRPERLPRRLWPVLERALDPMPSRRWPSMGALADRLAHEQRPRFSSRLRLLGALATGAAVAGIGSLAIGGPSAPSVESAPSVVEPIAIDPCDPGTELLDGEHRWAPAVGVSASAGELAIDLSAGSPHFISSSLQGPAQSFRDRAIEFEVARLPARDTAHELFLSVRNAEDEAFSVLVWGGQWVFPMAPNTHGLALEIDRERDRFFRIQVRDQRALPDIVTFEYSSDGEVWTPIARVEGSVGAGRISVSVGSHDPVVRDDRVILRSIRCTDLQPVAPLPEDRDLAREESPIGDPPRRY